jgi:hypothetical protein
VVRVLDYRFGGPGSIPGTTKKKVVGLERGPLSLVSTTEELLDRKVAAPVYKIVNTAVGIRHADHVASSIRKKLAITSPASGDRSVGIVRSRTQTMEFYNLLPQCNNINEYFCQKNRIIHFYNYVYTIIYLTTKKYYQIYYPYSHK